MQPNVGTIDRVFRAGLGLVLLLAPFVGNVGLFESAVASGVSIVVGLVLLGTAIMRVCALYSLLGINTCQVK